MREFFINLFTPLARYLRGVHPNTLTLIGVVTGGLAGVSYALAGYGAVFYLLGGALVGVSGAADSLDGIVARMYGRTSRTGDFMDHFFDRVVNIAIFTGLAFSPGASPILGLLTVIVVMLNSYLGTQIEASFGKRYYGGVGKAELFVGIIIGSVVLSAFQGAVFPVAGHSVSLVDVFFVLMGLSTLLGLLHRFRYALQLCALDEGPPIARDSAFEQVQEPPAGK